MNKSSVQKPLDIRSEYVHKHDKLEHAENQIVQKNKNRPENT